MTSHFITNSLLSLAESITDGCVSWEDTEVMMRGLAAAVRSRRLVNVSAALPIAESAEL